MDEDKVTGKQSMFDYIKKINDLNITNKKVKLIQEKLTGKLDVFLYPLSTVMQRVEDDGEIIETHWKSFGDNYTSLPVLHSTVPRYKESFGEYIALSFKEKMIIVDVLIQLFEFADRVPENTIEVLPEKKEDIIIEPEKKEKKKKEKKIKIILPKEEKKNETLPSKNKNATQLRKVQ